MSYIDYRPVVGNITNGRNIPRLRDVSDEWSNSSSLYIKWELINNRNIRDYIILWRKRPDDNVNEQIITQRYGRFYTNEKSYTIENLDQTEEYEVLIAPIGPSLVPEPFTLLQVSQR